MPQNYLSDNLIDEVGVNYNCAVLISSSPNGDDIFILGSFFMSSYIVTFDYGTSSLILTPNFVKAYLDTTALYNIEAWSIIMIILGSCLIVIYIGVLIFCCVKRRSRNIEAKTGSVD